MTKKKEEVSKPKKKTGAPPYPWTRELEEEICDAIATDSKGIRNLCKLNPHWPDRSTIFRHLAKSKSFGDLYARSKRAQVELMVDEMVEVADDNSSDVTFDKKKGSVIDHEHINRARLRIDTRKWIACKLIPRVYGDRQIIEENNSHADETLKEVLALRAELAVKNKKEY